MEIITNMSKYNDTLSNYQMYLRDLNISNYLNIDDVNSINIDMQDVLYYDFEIYDMFRKYPDQFIFFTSASLKEIYNKDFYPILKNLHEAEENKINEIRLNDTNNLFKFKGMVKRKSNVFPKVKETHYLCTNNQCPHSQDIVRLCQNEDTLKVMKCCSKCKSAIEEVGVKEVNYQFIVLEEMREELSNINAQPKSIKIEIEENLTELKREQKINVGSKVEVTGILRSRYKKIVNQKSIFKDFYVQAYNIELLDEDLENIKLVEEEKSQFEELSKKENITDILVHSTAPNLHNLYYEKLGLLCSLVGGNKKSVRGGRIHICFFGDPSKGKSQLLRFTKELMPRTIYSSGEGSSGVGLTASVAKDETMGGWTLEAGAFIQANGGYFLLDEMEKLGKENETKLNNGLENGEIPINKAGINATLRSDAVLIGAANPKMGKFDPNQDLYKQITIDPTILSRLDLTFFMLDTYDNKSDELIIDSIFEENNSQIEILQKEELRKYILYCKTFEVNWSKEAQEKVKTHYLKLRKLNQGTISTRQAHGIKRLCEAYTKLQLKKEVGLKEVETIITLMDYSQSNFNELELVSGVSNSSRSKNKILNYILEEFKKANKEDFTINEVMDNIIVKSSPEIDKKIIEEQIVKLKSEGIIFEPRKHLYKII